MRTLGTCLAHAALGALLVGLSGSTGPQGGVQTPPNHPPMPAPGERTYSLPNNSGFLELKWKYEDTGVTITTVEGKLYCENECKRKTHLFHSQCDRSCDVPCKTVHVVQMKPQHGSRYLTDLQQGAQQFGVGVPWLGDSMYGTVMNEVVGPLTTDPKYAVRYQFPCWNEKPCVLSARYPKMRFHYLVVEWSFYRFDTAPGDRKVRVDGPKGKSHWTVYVPTNDPYEQRDYLHCNCEIVSKRPEETDTGVTGPTTGGGGGRTPTTAGSTRPPTGGSGTAGGASGTAGGTGARPGTTGGAPLAPGGSVSPPPGSAGGVRETGMSGPWGAGELRIGYQGASYNGPPIDGKFLESVGFDVQIPSIQNALVSATNKTDKPIRFTICSGVMFICIKGDGQDTILVADLNFHLPPMTTETKLLRIVRPGSGQLGRVGSRDPNAFTPVPLTGRVLCLDIDKPMPTPGDVYRIGFGPSPEVVAIARKGGTQPIQGSWDQARIWIAKGAATIDKINSILIPPVAEAQYVRALQECAEWGGIDFLSETYRPCLQPKLALGLEAGGKALRRYAEAMACADGAALARFVSENLDKFAAKYSEARANDHAERIASLAAGMLAARDPAAASAALELLLRGMPEAGRARLATRSELSALNALLVTSRDSALVGKALEVVEALRPKGAAFGLVNLQPSLPMDLRSRATALAGTLK